MPVALPASVEDTLDLLMEAGLDSCPGGGAEIFAERARDIIAQRKMNPEAIDVFYFPDINGDGPVLTAGTVAGAFTDDEATMAVMEYLATSDYAETRQAKQTAELDGSISGYLSGAQGQDPSVYQPLEQRFLEILSTADFVRFDGGDLMPADVGAGSFWSEGTSLVNGDVTAEEAAANIQATWPQE